MKRKHSSGPWRLRGTRLRVAFTILTLIPLSSCGTTEVVAPEKPIYRVEVPDRPELEAGFRKMIQDTNRLAEFAEDWLMVLRRDRDKILNWCVGQLEVGLKAACVNNGQSNRECKTE